MVASVVVELLEQRIRVHLEKLQAAPEIFFETVLLADVPRLMLNRQTGESTRYLRVTIADRQNAVWAYEVLWGQYGSLDHSNDIDGRRGGDADFICCLAESWLVDWADRTSLPSLWQR